MAGKSPLTASAEQKQELEALAASRDRGEADRARAVLLTLRGWTSRRIAEAFAVREAMGCQRDIARKVLDRKADYILALKGNQGTLREDVEVFVVEQKASDFRDTKITRH